MTLLKKRDFLMALQSNDSNYSPPPNNKHPAPSNSKYAQYTIMYHIIIMGVFNVRVMGACKTRGKRSMTRGLPK